MNVINPSEHSIGVYYLTSRLCNSRGVLDRAIWNPGFGIWAFSETGVNGGLGKLGFGPVVSMMLIKLHQLF